MTLGGRRECRRKGRTLFWHCACCQTPIANVRLLTPPDATDLDTDIIQLVLSSKSLIFSPPRAALGRLTTRADERRECAPRYSSLAAGPHLAWCALDVSRNFSFSRYVFYPLFYSLVI